MSQSLPFPLSQSGTRPPSNHMSQNTESSPIHAVSASVPQAQQMSFQTNAQLPGQDMSALLQNISPEQLAVIGHLFQTGQLQLPIQPPLASAPSVPNKDAALSQQGKVPRDDDMDLDKEEGEWEDGETGAQTERDFLRPPPKGPRKRSPSPLNNQGSRSKRHISSPSQHLNARSTRERGVQQSGNNVAGVSNGTAQQGNQRQAKREAAKKFVIAAYRAGFSFDDFAREVGDAGLLRSLFQELDLTVSSAHKDKYSKARIGGKNNATPATAPSVLTSSKGVSTSQHRAPKAAVAASAENTGPSATKRSIAAKPTGVVDRAAYLAKLQAAKNKTATLPAQYPPTSKGTPDSGSSTTRPQALPATLPASRAHADGPSSGPAPQPAVQPPRKVNVNNDLVRQRLEALKKSQTQKQQALANASGSGVTIPPGTADSTLQSHNPMPAVKPGETRSAPSARLPSATMPASVPSTALPPAPQVDSISSPAQTTPNSQFPGLPGLFMTGSPFQANRSSQAFPRLGAAPPAPPARSPNSPSQRPGPQSNYTIATGAVAGHDAFPDASSALSTVASPAPMSKTLPGGGTYTSSSNVTPSRHVPPKRPFARGTYDSNDDSLIIQVSDEESELDDMDEDTDRTRDNASTSISAKPGPMHDFPSRHTFATQNGVSVPGTPGPTTPGSSALELELKMREIEKMNRKIAELQQQSKKAKASGTSTPVPRDDITKQTNKLEVECVSAVPTPASTQTANNATATATRSNMDAIPNQLDATIKDPDQQNSIANPLAENKRSQTIKDMELQVAQLQRETGATSQQPSNVNQGHANMSAAEQLHIAPSTAVLDEITSCSSLDDAMDVSSQSEGEDDEDMYDPVEQVEQDDTNAQATALSEAPGITTDATTVTSTNSQAASDPEYSESSLSIQEENAVLYPSGNEEHMHDKAPAEDEDLDSSISSSVSSNSDDEYEPEPAQFDASATEKPAAQDTSLVPSLPQQPLALPGLGLHTTTKSTISQIDHKTPDEDLAPELQPPDAEHIESDEEPMDKPKSFFTPYQSPLRVFKDYRYHPEFSRTVPGGFKSLTYSNKIDPTIVLCPKELIDGDCHDNSCQYQHLRGMAVNDNELLKDLGTRNIPNKAPEDDERWKKGLTEVVRQLRASNQGKDVNAIAARIAQFRRDFVGQPDKVLSLGLA